MMISIITIVIKIVIIIIIIIIIVLSKLGKSCLHKASQFFSNFFD